MDCIRLHLLAGGAFFGVGFLITVPQERQRRAPANVTLCIFSMLHPRFSLGRETKSIVLGLSFLLLARVSGGGGQWCRIERGRVEDDA